ncbi:MAG: pantetheine-phosphate adenylyltransferase [Myxococcales bacterium]|jgi:pantetheine-phosphate adenylyltransferase|nr:pantetheine-phosphate adenylyltransferase [Myxococcales bacterium]
MTAPQHSSSQRIAIYPGSFDPITNGHLDIAWRGLSIFDHLIVGIARNTRKDSLFSVEERQAMIAEIFADEPRVEVDIIEGLTVDYAMQRGARAILRGLRAVSDFENEMLMANMNRKLHIELETLFMMTSEKSFFVSSSGVKEIARFGGEIDCFVPELVARALREKYAR